MSHCLESTLRREEPLKNFHLLLQETGHMFQTEVTVRKSLNTDLAVSLQLSLTPRWMSWDVRKQGCPPSSAKPVRITDDNSFHRPVCVYWGTIPVQRALSQGCTKRSPVSTTFVSTLTIRLTALDRSYECVLLLWNVSDPLLISHQHTVGTCVTFACVGTKALTWDWYYFCGTLAPVSVEILVLVLLFSNIMAIDFPCRIGRYWGRNDS